MEFFLLMLNIVSVLKILSSQEFAQLYLIYTVFGRWAGLPDDYKQLLKTTTYFVGDMKTYLRTYKEGLLLLFRRYTLIK